MSKKRVRHHVNPLADQTDIQFDGFGDARPVIIDVGADRGEFSAGLLEVLGETHNFIVSEIRKPLAEKLRVKFQEHENVFVTDGDFVRNFESIIVPCLRGGAHIETIYLNFPDPWFKDRHHKRRVLCQRLIDIVRTVGLSDTEWVYQTDQKQIFDDTVELLRENDITDITYFDAPPYDVETKWEKAKTAEGNEIHRMRFKVA